MTEAEILENSLYDELGLFKEAIQQILVEYEIMQDHPLYTKFKTILTILQS